jgi:hypothetical protein
MTKEEIIREYEVAEEDIWAALNYANHKDSGKLSPEGRSHSQLTGKLVIVEPGRVRIRKG